MTLDAMNAAMDKVFEQEQRNRAIRIARLEKKIAELELLIGANVAWQARFARDYPMRAKQNGIEA